MRISVVIPSKDSPTLPGTLNSLTVSASRAPSISLEVIVVDSSTRPLTVAPNISDRINLTVIRKDLRRLEARIEGIKATRGENIFSLDSDQIVHPDLLAALARATSAAVVIPELPLNGSHWAKLVQRTNERSTTLFRRRPTLDIPVIPRFYRKDALMKAIDALCDDAALGSGGRLPTRHEDTILFSYFLNSNRWTAAECVGFIDVPIFHGVPPLETTGQKFYHYGWDLGQESRRLRRGKLAINPSIWRNVYRVDYTRVFRYWDSELGLDTAGITYDLYRSAFYFLGVISGYFTFASELVFSSRNKAGRVKTQ